VLIMDRGGGAREIAGLVNLDMEREGRAMTRDLEGRLAEQRLDAAPHYLEVIVNAKNLAFLVERSRAQA
jgi:hypothetical protein